MKAAWMWVRFGDEYGEVWERISGDFVRRVSDGMIGGWFYGQGLFIIKEKI